MVLVLYNMNHRIFTTTTASTAVSSGSCFNSIVLDKTIMTTKHTQANQCNFYRKNITISVFVQFFKHC